MIPGPTLVIACPRCGAAIRRRTLLTGNTSGAEYWTDGKRVAPMLPALPTMTRCQACRAIFWLAEAPQLGGRVAVTGRVGTPHDPALDSAPFAAHLEAQDLVEAIELGLGSSAPKERQLRTLLLWAGNDRTRWPQMRCQPLADGLADENRRRLARLLDLETPSDRLLAAELARESGLFERTRELAGPSAPADLEEARSFILHLAAIGATKVARIPVRPLR